MIRDYVYRCASCSSTVFHVQSMRRHVGYRQLYPMTTYGLRYGRLFIISVGFGVYILRASSFSLYVYRGRRTTSLHSEGVSGSVPCIPTRFAQVEPLKVFSGVRCSWPHSLGELSAIPFIECLCAIYSTSSVVVCSFHSDIILASWKYPLVGVFKFMRNPCAIVLGSSTRK